MNPEELILHADFIRKLSRRLIADEHWAADVVQDTFLAALKKPPSKEKPLRAWLLAVAKNIALNKRQREQRKEKREQCVARSNRTPSTQEVVAREEMRGKVVDAVLELPEIYRSAVLLRFYENLPPREVARELNLNLETAKTRIKRGIILLREHLDKIHHGDRDKWAMAIAPFAGIYPTSVSAGSLAKGVLLMSAKTKIAILALVLVGLTTLVFNLFLESHTEDMGSSKDNSTLATQDRNSLPVVKSPEKEDEVSRLRSLIPPERYDLELTGKILARDTNQAINNARVKISLIPAQPKVRDIIVKTNASGRFSAGVSVIKGLEIQALHMLVQAHDFLDLETYTPFKKESHDFWLHPIRTHQIRIVDLHDNPIPDARVEFFMENHRFRRISDTEGGVHITDEEMGKNLGHRHKYGLRTVITAKGFAPYHTQIRKFPATIKMEKEGTWTCSVKDIETNKGIAFAEVLIGKEDEPWNCFRQIRTDESGVLRIPKFSLDHSTYPRVLIQCEGYFPKLTGFGIGHPCRTLPEETKLRPIIASKKVQVINAVTKQPLPNLGFELSYGAESNSCYHKTKCVTDANGCFDCDFVDLTSNYSSFRSPGYAIVYYPFPHPNEMRENPWRLEIRPQITRKLQVLDHSENPIPNLRVHITPRSSDYGDDVMRGVTDANGIVCFNTGRVAPGSEAKLLIYDYKNPGYFERRCVLNENPEKLQKIYFYRGTLHQKIRVLDEDGFPVKDQTVVAALQCETRLNGGRKNLFSVEAVTNDNGWCELLFPKFEEGTLSVKKAPYTKIPITFNDIKDQSQLTLVIKSTAFEKTGIQGKITDQNGDPIKGAWILLEAGRSGGPNADRMRLISDETGFFSAALKKGLSYNIRVSPVNQKNSQGNQLIYTSGKHPPVKAGDKVQLTLTSWPTHLGAILEDCDFTADQCNAWLEYEDGAKVTYGFTRKSTSPAFPVEEPVTDFQKIRNIEASSLWRLVFSFYGLPANARVRVVIKTDQGRLFESEFMDVKPGRYNHVDPKEK